MRMFRRRASMTSTSRGPRADRRFGSDIERGPTVEEMSNSSHGERFRKTVERLAGEVNLLLKDQIALEELLGKPGSSFLRACFDGLMGDRLARLIRILEDDPRGAVSPAFTRFARCRPGDTPPRRAPPLSKPPNATAPHRGRQWGRSQNQERKRP